jgi:hypothetical protein
MASNVGTAERRGHWIARRKSDTAINLPENEATLDSIFQMLRTDDSLLSSTVGLAIGTAAFFATLAGIVLAIGLGSIAFPIPKSNMLQVLQPSGIVWPGMASSGNQGALVVTLVGEFLLLLVTTGYFTWYPVVRSLFSQRNYSRNGVKYLLANASEKRAFLQEALMHRISLADVLLLNVSVGLPFLLLILSAMTSLYTVLLHLPA